jgi:hypothetical protein
MALYFAGNTNATTPAQQNLTSTEKTLQELTSQTAASGITLSRAFIYEFEVGASGTPNATDCAIVWDVVAMTTIGTGTAGVANPLDQADAATSHVSTINHTAEPTVTANSRRWQLAANQRASYRWVVNPGGPGELVIPATNLAGLGIRAKSTTYASTADAGMYYRE